MRVLFVDGDVLVLEALERMLSELASDWETRFITCGDWALVELAKERYDAIVSDIHLPGLDGVALLTRVAELYPRMLRVVLSGHADERASFRLANVAHQFLAKPCAAETVHQVIARAQQLDVLLPEPALQNLAGRVGALPCSRSLQLQLLAATRTSGDSKARTLAALIKQDPGMTSKLLQLATSAFFNNAASVADVETAIMRLGLDTVTSLIHSCQRADRPADVESAQARSLQIASLAASMARLPEDASAAYLAGLLCDVGHLVADRAHAEVGAYLLGRWGLPFQIVEAVANHHRPERGREDRAGLTQFVWLASCIVDFEEPAPDLLEHFSLEALYAAHRPNAAFPTINYGQLPDRPESRAR
jgi:DNA-binding NarL/FixJ family response regulator